MLLQRISTVLYLTLSTTMPLDDDASPFTGGVTFVSFIIFGVVPLLSHLISLALGLLIIHDTALYLSSALTVIAMFFPVPIHHSVWTPHVIVSSRLIIAPLPDLRRTQSMIGNSVQQGCTARDSLR
jgi:hypothetical protein